MRFLLSCLLVIMLSNCSFWASKEIPLTPSQIHLNIHAAANINPNVNNKPSPLELRIYQLSDSQAFEQASFVEIFNDPQGTLKTDLLVSRQLASIFPSESRQVVLPLAQEAKYIGIVGGFANYSDARNKVIYRLGSNLNAPINISVDGINISASEGE